MSQISEKSKKKKEKNEKNEKKNTFYDFFVGCVVSIGLPILILFPISKSSILFFVLQ
jgi:hypothetical protein